MSHVYLWALFSFLLINSVTEAALEEADELSESSSIGGQSSMIFSPCLREELRISRRCLFKEDQVDSDERECLSLLDSLKIFKPGEDFCFKAEGAISALSTKVDFLKEMEKTHSIQNVGFKIIGASLQEVGELEVRFDRTARAIEILGLYVQETERMKGYAKGAIEILISLLWNNPSFFSEDKKSSSFLGFHLKVSKPILPYSAEWASLVGRSMDIEAAMAIPSIAFHIYQSFGFVPCGEVGMYICMRLHRFPA